MRPAAPPAAQAPPDAGGRARLRATRAGCRSLVLLRCRRCVEQLPVFAVSLGLELVDRDEAQRRRVDAVALARRRGAVVEDVAQVRVGALRADLGATHEERAIVLRHDVRPVERPREAGPAGPRVELVARAEQWLAR